jgi:hypothetical protein
MLSLPVFEPHVEGARKAAKNWGGSKVSIEGNTLKRTLPSEVVGAIDLIYPWAENGSVQQLRLTESTCPALSAIAALAESIPGYLITLTDRHLGLFLCAKAAIRSSVDSFWNTSAAERLTIATCLTAFEFHGKHDPVITLRACLAKCPDSVPAPGTANLAFFQSEPLRNVLREEMSDAEHALITGSWKAATVLGGAVLEAILFWAIKGMSSDLDRLPDKPKEGIEKLELHRLIDVARKLRLIKESTKTQASLARDSRNLVHPGAVLQGLRECDKSSSLTVLAAIETVVRDISEFCAGSRRVL